MFLLTVFISLLLLFYAVVILYYYQNWNRMPLYEDLENGKPAIKFSIIIPARNEEANIGKLLQSIQQQTYPQHLFEVIVVDDHSTDHTANLVKQFPNVHLLQLKEGNINSYKKKAIETGIAAAQNEWIVCTDADCIVPPKWLQSFASLIANEDPVFVAAPVKLVPYAYTKESEVLYIFQALDFLTLQGIAAASVFGKKHNMCNGANLAYKRKVFYEVAGFRGIDNIASGDDMLLMHKIWQKYPTRIAYLKSKSVIVTTEIAPTWKAFVSQRIRWASKASSYDDKRIFAVLLLVYLFNFSFLVLLIATFFKLSYLYVLIAFWILKTGVEFSFVSSVSTFFSLQQLMRYFFLFQPIHIAYTIVAGFFGSFGKYEWKGRRVK